jgi:hypothetical protein
METHLSRVERFRQFKQEIRGNERYLNGLGIIVISHTWCGPLPS